MWDPTLLFALMAAAAAAGVVLHERARVRFRRQFEGRPGFDVTAGPHSDFEVRYVADGVTHRLSPAMGAWIDVVKAPVFRRGSPFFVSSTANTFTIEPLGLRKLVLTATGFEGVTIRALAPRALAGLLTRPPVAELARQLFVRAPTSWSVDDAGELTVMRSSTARAPEEGHRLILETHALLMELVRSGLDALPALDEVSGGEGPPGGSPLAVPWRSGK